MVEDDMEHLLKLTGEKFYNNIEEEYGQNVLKILKYHDIDNYHILSGVSEHEILGIFETKINENSSNELITLMKELCNFVGDKVSLKVGTKGKIIALLGFIRDIIRKRKAKTLAEKKANQLNRSESPLTLLNSDGNVEKKSMELLGSVRDRL